MRPATLLFWFVTLFACACGGTQTTPSRTDRLSVQRLYPLRQGSIWSYDVDTGEGPPILAITRVLSNDGHEVEVSSGSDPVRYALRDEGLYRIDRGGFVLKEPLREGATWEAGGGATVRVVSTSRDVETPAGSFSGCLEVLETGGVGGKQVRSVYCADVGPVEVESSMQMDLSGDVVRVVARLRGYDFSAALSAAEGP
jgi:hypothetical protein